MSSTGRPYGIIAEFTTAAGVLHAAQKVRDAGFSRWDVLQHDVRIATAVKVLGWIGMLTACAWVFWRAWRDRATLGEALSRDFTPGQAPRDRKNRRDTDA